MMMDTNMFSQITVPWKVTIGLFLFPMVTLGTIFVGEKFRNEQRQASDLAKKEGREPKLVTPNDVIYLLWSNAFQFLLISISWAMNMGLPYVFSTAYIVYGPTIILTAVKRRHPRFFELLTSKYGFGGRGCVLSVGIVGSLYQTLLPVKINNVEYIQLSEAQCNLRFLSMCCFAMAAWVSCGLGYIDSLPRYSVEGNFLKVKRLFIFLIQLYFIGGFYLQFVSHFVGAEETERLAA
jgi:hypothetical protein